MHLRLKFDSGVVSLYLSKIEINIVDKIGQRCAELN